MSTLGSGFFLKQAYFILPAHYLGVFKEVYDMAGEPKEGYYIAFRRPFDNDVIEVSLHLLCHPHFISTEMDFMILDLGSTIPQKPDITELFFSVEELNKIDTCRVNLVRPKTNYVTSIMANAYKSKVPLVYFSKGK